MNKEHEAKENRLSPELFTGIILALFFGIALYLRVYLPYNQVFSGEWIKFTGVDAYYHMHLVDNLVRNFPRAISFDPYMIYPGGVWVTVSFFDWLLASIIWLIGLGSPTQHTIDVVGVYFPAILGALIVIPVYFIGKELFGRWAGVLSAGLIAFMPGEFLGRSILGFTDQHVAEVLFSTVAILFLILAINVARQRQLTFNHLKHRDWATSTKPIIYSLLSGLFLGIYLITWAGALLFVFTITAYLIIQFIIDHWKHKSTDYLCLSSVILFFTALIIFLSVSQGRLQLASLVIALLIPLVLNGISRLMASRGMKPAYYPLSLVGLGLAGLAIFYIINPSLLDKMLSSFSIFTPAGASLTTIEMQPFLFPRGDFSTQIAWGNFTTGFFLSFISLGILIYLIIKHGSADKSLLVVWSLVMLAATLGQRRFAYYFAVNIALLTGYLSWQILSLAGFNKLVTRPADALERLKLEKTKTKSKKGYQSGFRITTRHVIMSLAAIVVFFLVFFPNIRPAITTAEQARFAPTDAWMSSLSWLKEDTPDPFGNADFYYQFYEPPSQRDYHRYPEPGASTSELIEWMGLEWENYKYPESAYGIMAWWDYGYWITRIAHRLPNTHPGQPPVQITLTARFFLSQDEDLAREISQELGSSYIIIDYQTATSKFWAMAIWAGRDQTEFFDNYVLIRENKPMQVTLFHPEYYRSLSTKLYNFDGKAVTPERIIVISYEERFTPEGKPFKLITTDKLFTSYEEAASFVSSQKSGNYRIVGNSPFVSPVPLEPLKYYQLVHSSDDSVTQPGVGPVPEVKIFKYTK